MVDFSNLKKADVKEEALVEYPLTMIDGSPILMIAPATEANKPFFNAALKRARATRVIASKSINANSIDENREKDKETFAEFIVKGWKSVKDSSGKEVPFTKENALDFLKALPNWIFDDMRLFASNPSNFMAEQFDVDETAKN